MRHVFFNSAYNRAVEEGSFLMERVPILAVGDLKSELSQMDRRHLGDLLLPA
jgi:hypothetical protein